MTWADESGMLDLASDVLDLAPWHYGLVFTRAAAPGVGLLGRPVEESR
jgi:hypothetical protein